MKMLGKQSYTKSQTILVYTTHDKKYTIKIVHIYRNPNSHLKIIKSTRPHSTTYIVSPSPSIDPHRCLIYHIPNRVRELCIYDDNVSFHTRFESAKLRVHVHQTNENKINKSKLRFTYIYIYCAVLTSSVFVSV